MQRDQGEMHIYFDGDNSSLVEILKNIKNLDSSNGVISILKNQKRVKVSSVHTKDVDDLLIVLLNMESLEHVTIHLQSEDTDDTSWKKLAIALAKHQKSFTIFQFSANQQPHVISNELGKPFHVSFF